MHSTCCHKCDRARIELEKQMYGIPIFMLIVCPLCGNKRCPKASDHTLECTGSNEPGQPGSVYAE